MGLLAGRGNARAALFLNAPVFLHFRSLKVESQGGRKKRPLPFHLEEIGKGEVVRTT